MSDRVPVLQVQLLLQGLVLQVLCRDGTVPILNGLFQLSDLILQTTDRL